MKHDLALPKQKHLELDLLRTLCDNSGVSAELVLRLCNISRLDMTEKTKLDRVEQAIKSYIETENAIEENFHHLQGIEI
ncbi:hypothetical protein P4555_01805 [Peribacillus frigoritolerans]|uniref:hypothetical protein n=1 Tax=Peribacillus frigoritolerans TaxID=450367 RepID=UPI002E1E4191|nr:hypothetical protein [Peribacillus frigoritolerans]